MYACLIGTDRHNAILNSVNLKHRKGLVFIIWEIVMAKLPSVRERVYKTDNHSRAGIIWRSRHSITIWRIMVNLKLFTGYMLDLQNNTFPSFSNPD